MSIAAFHVRSADHVRSLHVGSAFVCAGLETQSLQNLSVQVTELRVLLSVAFSCDASYQCVYSPTPTSSNPIYLARSEQ